SVVLFSVTCTIRHNHVGSLPMKKVLSLSASVAIASLSLAAVPASAAQFGTLKPGLSSNSSVVHVGWRCGRGRHWSYRLGHCVWN
ncbi:MAG: hypothetical protein ACRETL_07005, partial [Gammaproteobacteria bacterium]